MKIGKMFFISLQKLFPFSRMEMKFVNEIWPVCIISQKKKSYQNIFPKIANWKLVPRPLENETFEASLICNSKASKILKFVKISMQTSSNSFLQRIL